MKGDRLMAKYVVEFNNGNPDVICNTYDSARNLKTKGWYAIHCAPDEHKKWNTMETLPENIEVWLLRFGMPNRGIRHGKTVRLPDVPLSEYPTNNFDGWLPMSWFRYFAPDDAAMAWWQEQDEYGDGPDYDPTEY
jgi:hypothetical protein